MPNNVVKRYITLCLLLDCSKGDLTKKGNYYLNQTAKNAGVKTLVELILIHINYYFSYYLLWKKLK